MSEHVAEGTAGRTVLVIEDDQAIGNMLVTLLAAEGYRPTLVTDGRAALDAVRALQPALVTLDLALPGLDGQQILDALGRDGELNVPVVVVSAYTSRLTPAQRARVAAVVHKPFEVDTLLSCISTALGDA